MTTKPASQIGSAGQLPRLTWLPDPPVSPDMQEQFPYISRAYVILEDHFRSRPDVFVGGEGYLCYSPSDIPNAPKPDCMVATGLEIPPAEITESNGYAISEIGKPPDFVLEVASKSTGQRDYTDKRAIYAGYGVVEYWRFDHTGGRYHDAALAGDRLVDGIYEPIPTVTGEDGVIRGYSAALGLELRWYEGGLRFWDPTTGEYLPELTEAKAQRDAALERVRQLEAELARRQSGG
ncbi:MAG: Uma2 family endonuclease [Chloroflexi bacterium]|nr:Uma2 family endonuclease [Chloroflexota bacterium]